MAHLIHRHSNVSSGKSKRTSTPVFLHRCQGEPSSTGGKQRVAFNNPIAIWNFLRYAHNQQLTAFLVVTQDFIEITDIAC